MKRLLQELLDLELYKDCLEKDLYQVYKNYLHEKILNEVNSNRLANTFKNKVFNKKEMDSEKATVNILKQLQKIASQFKYEKLHGQIIPNTDTHLETNSGKPCTKEVFVQEFEKENFSEFEGKEDLNIDTLVEKLLKGYLEMYDENGWLILKNDDYEKIQDK